MRRHRSNFKLWMLMIAVAVVALALGIARIWYLRNSYMQKAAENALEERDELKVLGTLDMAHLPVERTCGRELETLTESVR